MVLSSGPVSTFVSGFASIRGMSCSGTGSIMSTWPDSSAATRVASAPIGVKTTLVMLNSRSSQFHQSSLALKVVRTPCSWLSTLNGPVPFALRDA